jgi:hypothetical protein
MTDEPEMPELCASVRVCVKFYILLLVYFDACEIVMTRTAKDWEGVLGRRIPLGCPSQFKSLK